MTSNYLCCLSSSVLILGILMILVGLSFHRDDMFPRILIMCGFFLFFFSFGLCITREVHNNETQVNCDRYITKEDDIKDDMKDENS